MKKTEKLKELADILISTLGSMPSEEADKKVKQVAEAIYEIIGKRGKIVGEVEGFIDYRSPIGAPRGVGISRYKFEEEK